MCIGVLGNVIGYTSDLVGVVSYAQYLVTCLYVLCENNNFDLIMFNRPCASCRVHWMGVALS